MWTHRSGEIQWGFVLQKVVIQTAHWKHSEEGESDEWTDKAHFSLRGRRLISAAVGPICLYVIDETAHGATRGLNLESAYLHSWKMHRRAIRLVPDLRGAGGPSESLELVQPIVQENMHPP